MGRSSSCAALEGDMAWGQDMDGGGVFGEKYRCVMEIMFLERMLSLKSGEWRGGARMGSLSSPTSPTDCSCHKDDIRVNFSTTKNVRTNVIQPKNQESIFVKGWL